MNAEEVRLFNWRRKSRRSIVVSICRQRSERTIVVAILLGAKVSEREWTSGRLWAWEFSERRCSQKKERLPKQLSVLGRRNDLRNSWVSSKGEWSWEGYRPFSTSRRYSEFLLGPAMSMSVRRVYCLFGMLLTRWNTCLDPDEDQNLTIIVTNIELFRPFDTGREMRKLRPPVVLFL